MRVLLVAFPFRAKVPRYGAAIETSIETGRALILTFTVETLKYSVALRCVKKGEGSGKKKGAGSGGSGRADFQPLTRTGYTRA